MKEKVAKIKKFISIINLGWSVFTVASLITFGVTFLQSDTAKPYAIIVFLVAAFYLGLNIAKYVVGPKKKKESVRKKDGRKVLSILFKIAKIALIVLPLFTLNPDLTMKFTFPKLTKVFSLIWLCINIGIEITNFILRLIMRKIVQKFKKKSPSKDEPEEDEEE